MAEGPIELGRPRRTSSELVASSSGSVLQGAAIVTAYLLLCPSLKYAAHRWLDPGVGTTAIFVLGNSICLGWCFLVNSFANEKRGLSRQSLVLLAVTTAGATLTSVMMSSALRRPGSWRFSPTGREAAIWHFADAIPLLDLTKVFGLTEPATSGTPTLFRLSLVNARVTCVACLVGLGRILSRRLLENAAGGSA